MKYVLLAIFVCLAGSACKQTTAYTTANAHSHNDYENKSPFFGAYAETFGSIEADIFLRNDSLIIGHKEEDLQYRRTLENLYLRPLSECAAHNNGQPFKDSSRQLQLMIDLKTEGRPALNRLVEVLQHYPLLIHSRNIQFVISGNRPADSLFTSYPPYIWFDGELSRHYSAGALSRIVMLSDDLKKYTKWDGKASLAEPDYRRLDSMVHYAHSLQKKVRFWDAPDSIPAWNELMKLQVDYINTDRISELSSFFQQQKR
jgi:alkaline phosphatase